MTAPRYSCQFINDCSFKKKEANSWVSLRHNAVNLTRGSASNVLMLMLHWSEKMVQKSTHLPPNTRLMQKTNNRLTLITVFCFRVVTFVTSYETQELRSFPSNHRQSKRQNVFWIVYDLTHVLIFPNRLIVKIIFKLKSNH
jgi:hypothetical protein